MIAQNVEEIYSNCSAKVRALVQYLEIEYDHLRTDSRSCESRRCRVRPVIVKDNRAHFLYVYART